MIYLLLTLFFFPWFVPVYAHPFSYDTALAKAHNEEWSQAKEELTDLVVHKTPSADLLYDTGVVSYKAGDTTQAIAYFEQAAITTASLDLKEKSYFNAGNGYAAEHDFKNAADAYQKALDINPDNENTRHNYEIVSQLLEQKQNQQEQEEPDEHEQQDDDTDEQDNESTNDASQKDQSDEQSDTQEEQQEQQQGTTDQNCNSDQQQNGGSDNDSEQEQQTGNDSVESSDQTDQDSSQDVDQDVDSDKYSQDAQQSQMQQEHDEQVLEEQENTGQESMHEALEKEENKWMVSLLEDEENKDSALQKKFLRARLHNNAASGESHAHNW